MAAWRQRRGLIVGFAAQVLQYGASLLMLPFLVARLSSAEVGVWYLLITVQGLATIADFGFGGAFARSIASAMAGAGSLRTVGMTERVQDTPNYALAAQVVRAARMWYLGLSMAILTVMLTLGLWYVTHVTAGYSIAPLYAQVSWCVMAFSIALTMYFSWANPILVGAGRVEQDMISQIIGRGGFAVLGIGTLALGGGLVSLAVAQMVALILARAAAALFMRPIVRQFPAARPNWAETKDVLRVIAPNASRFGISGLSGFLITRSSVFVVSTLVGLEAGASYAISLQLVGAVMQVSQVPLQFSVATLVDANVKADRARIWRLTVSLTGVYCALFLTGAAIVVFVGPPFFHVMSSHIRLLSTPLLLLLSFVFLLEGIHWVSAFVLLTGNRVPFTSAAVISGAAVAVGSFLAGWMGLGVAGIIACQGLVQLAYNNWRWPLMVYRETRP